MQYLTEALFLHDIVHHECPKKNIAFSQEDVEITMSCDCGLIWQIELDRSKRPVHNPTIRSEFSGKLADSDQNISDAFEDYMMATIINSGMPEKEASELTLFDGIELYNKIVRDQMSDKYLVEA